MSRILISLLSLRNEWSSKSLTKSKGINQSKGGSKKTNVWSYIYPILTGHNKALKGRNLRQNLPKLFLKLLRCKPKGPKLTGHNLGTTSRSLSSDTIIVTPQPDKGQNVTLWCQIRTYKRKRKTYKHKVTKDNLRDTKEMLTLYKKKYKSKQI